MREPTPPSTTPRRTPERTRATSSSVCSRVWRATRSSRTARRRRCSLSPRHHPQTKEHQMTTANVALRERLKEIREQLAERRAERATARTARDSAKEAFATAKHDGPVTDWP